MVNMSHSQCGDLLVMWLHKVTSPESVESLAKEIGYKTSSLFGAKKRRTRFMGELVLIHVALAMHAVNMKFDTADSKAIIDPFLASANETLFKPLDAHDANFTNKYEQRLTEYIGILFESKAALGLSFAFLRNCEIDPLNSLRAQLFLAEYLGGQLEETLDVLSRLELEPLP